MYQPRDVDHVSILLRIRYDRYCITCLCLPICHPKNCLHNIPHWFRNRRLTQTIHHLSTILQMPFVRRHGILCLGLRVFRFGIALRRQPPRFDWWAFPLPPRGNSQCRRNMNILTLYLYMFAFCLIYRCGNSIRDKKIKHPARFLVQPNKLDLGIPLVWIHQISASSFPIGSLLFTQRFPEIFDTFILHIDLI